MTQPLGPGVLLLADPILLEPHFARTVILLCEHSEKGAMGLVLNRPLQVLLEEVLQEPDALAEEGAVLHWGGPVSGEQLCLLHGGESTSGEQIVPGVVLDADMEAARSARKSDRPVRFFLGYAGWGEGQLEDEMDEGSWRIVPATAEAVFAESSSALWAHLIADQDPDLAWIRHVPDDPSVN